MNFPIDWRFWKITVYSIYARALVISAQQEEILGIFNFVCEQEANCLERLLSWKKVEDVNKMSLMTVKCSHLDPRSLPETDS